MVNEPKPPLPSRQDYPWFLTLQMRWGDFDMFGHVNNVAYFRYYETLLVRFLSDELRLNWLQDPIAPFVAENSCRFIRPIEVNPEKGCGETLEGALRVEALTTRSVRYGLALFEPGHTSPSAVGHWVHVFVDRQTQRPVPIPEAVRAGFLRFQGPLSEAAACDGASPG